MGALKAGKVVTVGLDARPTEPGFKAHFGRGTGRYASEVMRQFKENSAFSGDRSIRFEPIPGTRLRGNQFEEQLLGMIPFGRQTLKTQFILPHALKRLDVDLFHFFAHGDAPAWSETPFVVTVLDLIPLKFAEMYKPKRATWRFKLARSLENRAIQAAHGILAISEATKRDVMEILGVSSERIFVTPLAVGEEFDPEPTSPDARTALFTRLGLRQEERYLLYIGGIDQRKNVEFLLRAYAGVRERMGEKTPLLLLVGRYEDEETFPALQAEVVRLGLLDFVRFPGFIPDRMLPALYREAELKLFPSLYEGFGLPVLEAMGCGTPVVAANNSAIPEIAGRAAVLVTDNDLDSWVQEISSLLGSDERRAELRELGLKQAKRFSWERTASMTLEAYRYFLSSKL